MKSSIFILTVSAFLAAFSGCATNQQMDHSIEKASEIARLREENTRLKSEAKASKSNNFDKQSNPEYSNQSGSTTKSSPRKVITYNELLDTYSIRGNGKYGYVSLDARYSELFDRFSISGTVGDNYISMDCWYSKLLDKTSVSGYCDKFGYASLDIHYSSLFRKATLSGSIGDNFVDVSITGVNKTTHWTITAVNLIALLFDAK